jgi:glycosyltransferase involved in cell wall biosynthesis
VKTNKVKPLHTSLHVPVEWFTPLTSTDRSDHMKQIHLLFVAHDAHICGVNRSLIELLGSLDPRQFRLSLFLFSHRGDLLSSIPETVSLLPEDPAYQSFSGTLWDSLLAARLDLAFDRLRAAWAARVPEANAVDDYSFHSFLHHYAAKHLPMIGSEEGYDCAISFVPPHDLVASKVEARIKLAWIHTDYSSIAISGATEVKALVRYDRIVCVSADVSRLFFARFGELAEKGAVIENILRPQKIKWLSMAFDPSNEMAQGVGKTIICTVASLVKAKGLLEGLEICRRLKEMQTSFCWFVIGGGPELHSLEREVQKRSLAGTCVFLGPKANPLPYVRASDIYLHTSTYEGKSLAVREAQILNKPVILRRFPTARSHVGVHEDAVIVSADPQLAAIEINRLLRSRPSLDRLVANTRLADYSVNRDVELFQTMVCDLYSRWHT